MVGVAPFDDLLRKYSVISNFTTKSTRMQTGRRERCTRQHKLIHELCLVVSGDESHLLLRSHLTMEDLESEEFKVHDPRVAWLNGKGRWRMTVA